MPGWIHTWTTGLCTDIAADTETEENLEMTLECLRIWVPRISPQKAFLEEMAIILLLCLCKSYQHQDELRVNYHRKVPEVPLWHSHGRLESGSQREEDSDIEGLLRRRENIHRGW